MTDHCDPRFCHHLPWVGIPTGGCGGDHSVQHPPLTTDDTCLCNPTVTGIWSNQPHAKAGTLSVQRMQHRKQACPSSRASSNLANAIWPLAALKSSKAAP